MFKFSYIFLFVIYFCINANVIANEGSATSTDKPVVIEKEFSGHQTEKWSDVQNTLAQLKTKVDAQAMVVSELLRLQKNNDEKISNNDIDELSKQNEKLKKLTKDYNEMLSDFQFRFPEKGLESGRKYIRTENQSVEKIENSSTFEGRLKKLNRKIKHQYQAEDSAEDIKKQQKLKSLKTSSESKKIDSKKNDEPQVTDQINLVK